MWGGSRSCEFISSTRLWGWKNHAKPTNTGKIQLKLQIECLHVNMFYYCLFIFLVEVVLEFVRWNIGAHVSFEFFVKVSTCIIWYNAFFTLIKHFCKLRRILKSDWSCRSSLIKLERSQMTNSLRGKSVWFQNQWEQMTKQTG